MKSIMNTLPATGVICHIPYVDSVAPDQPAHPFSQIHRLNGNYTVLISFLTYYPACKVLSILHFPLFEELFQ